MAPMEAAASMAAMVSGMLGTNRRDPVAGFDAGRLHRLGETGDEIVELAVGETALHLVFPPEDQGIGVVAPAQQILGIVEPRLGEEMRAGHPAGILDAHPARALTDNAGEFPHRAPEGLRLGD